MDSKIEIIKNKIWEITEKTERIDEYGEIVHVVDICGDYIKKHEDILNAHAILPDFNCPVCGSNVRISTLYSDVKHYFEIADNISLPELFPLIGLLELMYHGQSFDSVTCSSFCLSCHKQYQIDEISKIISSKDSKINQHNFVLVN